MESNSGKYNGIRHSGVVTAISGDIITVSFISQSACASCHVRSACSASDIKEKVVEANLPHGMSVVVGDEVDVLISQSNGYLAVIASYLIPVIIIFTSIITAINIGCSELVGAFGGLVLMVVYFMVLYLFRKKIDKKMVIEVVSKEV